MTVFLAVGLTWLLAGTVVAAVIARAIRQADAEQPAGAVLDRLLVEGYPDLEAAHASSWPTPECPRAARRPTPRAGPVLPRVTRHPAP
jgi:hypothetical protein